ncbi:UDP-N-acetylglucosamine--N-acetylmuramyl-(pentapeptide) pyrophosphoryl-undecaprenol N-acetylglucosamine transferase [Desulfacinum hydrothermale DSM 13146]|uniref:UDP-N-acetylglucosamine--N-acetylmuramyl-(pentapeptide) pyrophosphoryl-undecaprenol N-acetylglucosamine transferase n=1 Tax=Desulfacinum hydrothermale DSM 13146 TaxID=1121390 RepID=A0A1W1XHL9_9BACT|nr:glycosyltransferase [Desulfacinum hydrothermale]SMC23459.1 UDP-N-acetylglucosamine--N-acetylmuramyl-(pentapeptide) pyrophosphoryl-undecaprenol N-acetylglucosamine transferase [Desulfacinum hydrothermale DSM 13146]
MTFLAITSIFFLAAGLLASWAWRRSLEGPKRVVLTGGGTGGHVNPALAVAEAIKAREPDTRFLYVGVRGKAEAVIVKRAGYPLAFVSSRGFPGLRPSMALIRFVFAVGWGMLRATGLLLRFRPHWILATGGYVSVPIVASAILLRLVRVAPVRIYLHEQNSVPGQMNGLLGRWADRVLLTFPQTLSYFPKNGVVVGYPVRHAIGSVSRQEALQRLGFRLPPHRRVVFVFGGSQGARTINRALVEALAYLAPHRHRIFIIHGTGLSQSADYHAAQDTEQLLRELYPAETLDTFSDFYYRQDYFHNIADVYAVSDLVVCRSGAGSLNELARLGKPALLIPKANLPGDHQVMNARAMKQAGAAEVLYEDVLLADGKVEIRVDSQELATRILSLLDDEERLQRMATKSRGFFRRKATARILSELYRDKLYDNGYPLQAVETGPAFFSNAQLLRRLQAAYASDRRGYDPAAVVGDWDDLTYYRHRAAALLAASSWQARNVGVKLIGLTRYREKIPALLHLLCDRTPAGRVQRLLGGDFEQVGFIRRNIVTALSVIGHLDSQVEQALLQALKDPYYEVRAETCRAVVAFGEQLAGKDAWVDALLERLGDSSFEVAMEAAKALGEVGVDGRVLEALVGLNQAFHWQVRNAALMGIKRLLERRVFSPSEEVLRAVNRFLLTAPDFRPTFTIRENYNAIVALCRQAGASREEVLPDRSNRVGARKDA